MQKCRWGGQWQPSKAISSLAAKSSHDRKRSWNCRFSLQLRGNPNQFLPFKKKKKRFNCSIIRDLEVLRACSAVFLLTGVPSSEMQLIWRGFLGTWGWIGQPKNAMLKLGACLWLLVQDDSDKTINIQVALGSLKGFVTKLLSFSHCSSTNTSAKPWQRASKAKTALRHRVTC